MEQEIHELGIAYRIRGGIKMKAQIALVKEAVRTRRKVLATLGELRKARKIACRPGATDAQYFLWDARGDEHEWALEEYEIAQEELNVHLRKRARHRRR